LPCLPTMGNAATAKKGNEQESGEHLEVIPASLWPFNMNCYTM